MENSRTKKVVLNAISSVVQQVIVVLVGFVNRKIFLVTIGVAYLGVNGLFSNILSLLAMSELGVGTAIIYSLYKPLAEGKEDEVCKLMNFYKQAYRLIAMAIVAIGVIICMFLGVFININESGFTLKELQIIFLLYLLQTASTYLFSYKRSLFFADQKAYITSYIDTGFKVFISIATAVIMVVTKNFYLYLILTIILNLINNAAISFYADKRYPYIKRKLKLETEKVRKIFGNIKNIFIHKVASTAITSTDNILISKFVGIAVVGLYSNYQLVIDSVSNIMRRILQSIQASVGNLLATEDTERAEEILYQATLVAHLIASFSSVALSCLVQDFIILVFGQEYTLEFSIVFISIFSFMLVLMKEPLYQFVSVSGLFKEDRTNAIIGMILNLGISLILVIRIGLAGVFLGTVISSIITFILKINFFYSKFLRKSAMKYHIVISGYIIISFAEIAITSWLCSCLIIENTYINFLFKMGMCVLIPNLINILLFWRQKDFQKLVQRGKGFLKKR